MRGVRILMAVLFVVTFVGLGGFVLSAKHSGKSGSPENYHPARYWESLGNKILQCKLCPHFCTLKDGQIGFCKARKNIDGKLYSMVYGKASSIHVDPIEKKPLYHFLPGSGVYSLSTTGCNLQCKFCQNWQISQVFPWDLESKPMTPAEIVEAALKSGSKSIAYTYNEPTISAEYMIDIATLARKKGLKNVVVSAGYINPEPLKDILKVVDAYKIDLKGFDEKFYHELTSAELAPVLEALKIIKQSGVHLEIVNLMITGENDTDEEMRKMCLWIKENLGTDVPVHFTRFHPDYKLVNKPPTPPETVKRARQIALEVGLKYVYTGNMDDPEGSTTYDPKTHEVLIERQGFFLSTNKVGKDGRAPSGEKIPGVWN